MSFIKKQGIFIVASKDIKETLATKFGGAAKDWERLSKSKNANKEVEREFRNKATNQFITVTETAGGEVYAVKQTVAAQAPGTLPVIDTDPARQAAAQRILKRTLLGNGQASREDLSEATLKKAGNLAYANLFLFAVIQIEPPDDKPGQYQIYVTPKAYFERNGFHDDDTYLAIGDLLPRYTDDPCGGNYYNCTPGNDPRSGVDPAPAPIDAARDMLTRGFFWNEDYQKAAEAHAREPSLFAADAIRLLIEAQVPRNCWQPPQI